MIELLKDKIIIDNHKIEYWIDSEEIDDYHVKISGWVIIENSPSWQLDLKLDFKGFAHNFSCKPFPIHRNDVTMINGKNLVNYDASGFLVEIPRQGIGEDKYNIYFNFKERHSNTTLLSFPFLCLRVY